MLIKWDAQKLGMQIQEIDVQHRGLVHLINELHEAMKEKKGKEFLGRLIASLGAYSVQHFDTEERYMTRYRYPGYEAHRQAHLAFTEKVNAFKKGYDEGQMLLTMEILLFLKEWLATHIQETDQEMGAFLRQQGLV